MLEIIVGHEFHTNVTRLLFRNINEVDNFNISYILGEERFVPYNGKTLDESELEELIDFLTEVKRRMKNERESNETQANECSSKESSAPHE